MRKPVLVLYTQGVSTCPCYGRIFNSDFEIVTAKTESQFLENLRPGKASVAVYCCCTPSEQTVQNLLRLEALAGPIPIVAFLETYDPDFIRRAGERRINHLLLCTMGVREIRAYIHKATLRSGLRSFLKVYGSADLNHSPYVSKIISEIVHSFPHRWRVRDLSRKLGISSRRLQMICREAFKRPFTRLIRGIWIYQALKLMQNTDLSNGEIADQLNYSEETSLARAFRKELGFSLSEARRRLAEERPEELLIH